MQPVKRLRGILRAALALDEVYASGENGHYQVIVVSSLFDGTWPR